MPHAIHVSKLYLSSDFAHRRHVRELAKQLVDLGYVIMSRWQDDMIMSDPNMSDASRVAMRNVLDIAKSDVIVVIGPTMGRKVCEELGFARASGLKVVMVNVREPKHLYDALPIAEEYSTEEEFIRSMDTIRGLRFNKEVWE